jgi:hypothetical protein
MALVPEDCTSDPDLMNRIHQAKNVKKPDGHGTAVQALMIQRPAL